MSDSLTDDRPDSALGEERATVSNGAYVACVVSPSLTTDAVPAFFDLMGRVVVGRGTHGASPGRLSFADDATSREHVDLFEDEDAWYVRDRESRNGTFVGGTRLRVGEAERLDDGAVVRLGATVLVFRYGTPPKHRVSDPHLPGHSPSMDAVRIRIRRLRLEDWLVLVLGSTGTGKEYAARALHARWRGLKEEGGHARGEFVPHNCALFKDAAERANLVGWLDEAFTGATRVHDGLLHAARDGTLFLDEIGELPLDHQADALRLFDDRTFRRVGSTKVETFSGQIVAATNRDLHAEVRDAKFREDLLARLEKVASPIRMPPLQERPEDIVEWLALFVAESPAARRDIQWDAGALESLMIYDWPTNLRQLQGVVNHALRSGRGTIAARDLPEEVVEARRRARHRPEPAPAPVAPAPPIVADEAAVRRCLERRGGNVSKAAPDLGLSRAQLNRRLKEFDIDPNDYR